MADIEDCVGPYSVGPLDRLRLENKVLPRALRRKGVAPSKPVADSFIPGTQSIYIKTWGCSHNNSDGEYMAGLLAANGYGITGTSVAKCSGRGCPMILCPFRFPTECRPVATQQLYGKGSLGRQSQ